MSCWARSESSSRPTAGRLAALGLSVVLGVVTLTGCGDDSDPDAAPGGPDSSGQLGTPTQTAAPRTPLPPGPAVPDDASIADDELVIGDEDVDAVRKAVKAEGGEVTKVVEEINVIAARFEVADRSELLRIRDALRKRGFDAQVSPLLSNPGAVTGEE